MRQKEALCETFHMLCAIANSAGGSDHIMVFVTVCMRLNCNNAPGRRQGDHPYGGQPARDQLYLPGRHSKKNLSSRPGSHFMRMPLPLTKIDSLLDTMTWSSPVYSKKNISLQSSSVDSIIVSCEEQHMTHYIFAFALLFL